VRRVLTLLGALGVMTISAGSAHAATVTVHVGYNNSEQFFLPSVTINQGDTIHWVWDSVPPFPGAGHSVTSGPVSSAPTGDGGFDSGVFTSAGATFDHAFSAPGTIHYFCKVHYAFGMVGTITVLGPDTAPTAGFTFSPSTPTAGQPVTFDASTSSDGDGDTVSGDQWNWGDGSAPTGTGGASTTHTYSSAGTFTPTLTVTDSRGTASAAVSHAITVSSPSQPAPPPSQTPTTTPPVPHLAALHAVFCLKKTRKCGARGANLSFTLSAPDRIVITLTRAGRRSPVKRITLAGTKGRNTVSLGLA
jgi:plastocyanin